MQSDLFSSGEPTRLYELIPHCCSHCGGRLLRYRDAAVVEVRCAECGESRNGEPEGLCCCGVMTADQRHPFRCELNTSRRPGHMNEVIVKEVFC